MQQFINLCASPPAGWAPAKTRRRQNRNMSPSPVRVLLVEDEPADAEFVKRALSAPTLTGFELCHVLQLSDAYDRLHTSQCDVLLLDLGLPEYCDLEALQEVRGWNQGIPIVVLSGLRNERTTLDALQHGAQDYLVKGEFTADSLSRSIRYAIQWQQLMAATLERKLALAARA